MPRLPIVALLVAGALPALAATGGTAVTLSQSGYLIGATDAPIDGPVTLVFRLYDDPSAGTLQWQGTCTGVSVRGGFYAVALGGSDCTGTGGAGDSLLDTSDVPPGQERWLAVEVNTLGLTPRLRIGSAPSAIDAGRLQGHPAADFALAGHGHAATAITGLANVATSGQYADLAGAPTSLPPTSHTHTTSDITGFPAAAVSAVTTAGVPWTSVSGKPTTFAPTSHTHTAAEVTGLPASLAGTTIPGTLTATTFFGQFQGFLRADPSPLPACDGTTAGLLNWNGTLLQACNGTAWATLGAGVIGSSSNPALSCKAIRESGLTTDAVYWVDPNGGAATDAFQTYCNLSELGGGWTLCLSVTSNESYASAINNVPDAGDWRTAVFETGLGRAHTTARPAVLTAGWLDNAKGGSFGCANVAGVTEIMVVAHANTGVLKGVTGTLPGNWASAADVGIAGTAWKKGGSWTTATGDSICYTRGALYPNTAASCADKYVGSTGGSTWTLGIIGSHVENGSGVCTATDAWNSCAAFLVDRQNVWSGEGDEIGDHGSYGGAGWSTSSTRVYGLNVFVR